MYVGMSVGKSSVKTIFATFTAKQLKRISKNEWQIHIQLNINGEDFLLYTGCQLFAHCSYVVILCVFFFTLIAYTFKSSNQIDSKENKKKK